MKHTRLYFKPWVHHLATGALALALAAMLGACADTAYYVQSATGHLSLMAAAKPVAEWLDDAQTPAALKTRLALAQRMRRFAVTDLGLPDNTSYTRYADLKRPAAVWNVVAASEFSLALKTWCFPVTGCVGYRGYFDEGDAKALAETLKAQGLEVSVYPVPAYSTLGWMNWAGGDPLLNTFIHYSEGELARLIFHELAHQVAYAKDDTMFNESFATAVERLGGERWMARYGSDAAKTEYELRGQRRREFMALTQVAKHDLARIYNSKMPKVPVNTALLDMKKIAFNKFRADYQSLRASWIAASGLNAAAATRSFGNLDLWVASANNASFGAQAAYDEKVPAFMALFEQFAPAGAAQWQQFYDAVQGLTRLPSAERGDNFRPSAQAILSN